MAPRSSLFLFLAPFLLLATFSSATDVTFIFSDRLSFGQGVVVTGNISALGDWTPANSPQLSLPSGSESSWSTTVSIDEGAEVAYKFVVVNYDDPSTVYYWVPSDNINLYLTVPSEATTVGVVDASGVSSVIQSNV